MLHDSPTSSAQRVDEGPRQRIGSMIVNQVALVFNNNGIKWKDEYKEKAEMMVVVENC